MGAGRAGFVASPGTSGSASIYGPNGQLIESVPGSGTSEGTKFVFSKSGNFYPPGSVVKAGGQSYTIGNTSQIYEGNSASDFGPSSKSPIGGGAPGFATPGQVGPYGFFPGYVPFPSPTSAQFSPIPGASYQYQDPMQYAQKYGPQNVKQIQHNVNTAHNMALSELNTELAGLKQFAPAATALRTQTNTALNKNFQDITKSNEDLRATEDQRFSELGRTEEGLNEDQRRSDIAKLSSQRISDISDLSDLRRSEISKNEDLRQSTIQTNAQTQYGLLGSDNSLNQSARTSQVDSVLPNARGDLAGQRSDALSYASGRAPNSVVDAGLEISNRDAAAGNATAGGFGANSSASRNLSDLMSAQSRIGLSQYGNSLLSTNLNQEAGLFLAPTEYANAAGQVRIEPGFSTDAGFTPDTKYSGDVGYSTAAGFSQDAGFSPGAAINQDSGISSSPSISGSQLQLSNIGMLNQANTIPLADQFSSGVQQAQFGANLQQSTQEFNAGNGLQASEFNAGSANQFALAGHDYNAGYAGTVAGAAQTNANTGLALAQQGQAGQIFSDYQGQAQASGQAGAVAAGVGSLAPIIAAGSQLIGGSSGILSGGGGGSGGGSGPAQTVTTPPGSYTIPQTGQTFPSGVSEGGGSGSIVTPEGGSIPPGYSGIMSGGGGTVSIPTGDGGSFDVEPAGLSLRSKKLSSAFRGSSGTPVSNDSGGGGSESGGGGGGGGGSESGGASGGQAQADNSSSKNGPAIGKNYDPMYTDPNLPQHASLASFKSDTGINVPSNVGNPFADYLKMSGNTVLNAAGIYNNPHSGTQPIGVSNSGIPLHASTALLKSNNAISGTQNVNLLKNVLNPMGVFKGKDADNIDRVANVSGDPNLIHTLDGSLDVSDRAGFVDQVLQAFGHPGTDKIADDPTGQHSALTAAASAHQLTDSWSQMSPSQKSLALAAVGLQGYRFSSGEDLASKFINPPVAPGDPYLTVGGALNLFSKGVNTYGLSKNWNQLNTIQRIAGGTPDVAQMANLAKSAGMLGYGSTNAAVPGVSAQSLAAKGFSAAPQYGVGAIVGGQLADVPKGFTPVTRAKAGGVIAVPTNSTLTAAGAVPQAGSLLNTAAGVGGIGAAANQIYKRWAPAQGNQTLNGAIGGSAMVAGLSGLTQSNPFLTSGIIAASTLANGASAKQIGQAAAPLAAKGLGAGTGTVAAIQGGISAYNILQSGASNKDKAGALYRGGENLAAAYGTGGVSAAAQTLDQSLTGGKIEHTRENLENFNPTTKANELLLKTGLDTFSGGGKSESQTSRDDVRSVFQNVGLADKDYNLTLADGSKFNVGIDGHGAQHGVTNPDALSPDQKGKVDKLNAWDLDYTNDLDYASGLGGITLSRLLNGGKSNAVDQMGSEMANGALGNVGYGQPLNTQTFAKTMANMRGFYAQSGIKSKADGYQLANQAFSEGRMDESDLLSAHKSLDMVFDPNGYQTANTLMAGRHPGIAAVANGKTPFPMQAPGQQLGDLVTGPGVGNAPAAAGVTSEAPKIKLPAAKAIQLGDLGNSLAQYLGGTGGGQVTAL